MTRKPTISPKSENNQDKIFKAESYHSPDGTSVIVNLDLDNEVPFVCENSENMKNNVSTSSPMKTAYTIADTTALSLQNSYEEGDSMQPDENNISSREFPFLLTTDSVILKPKILTEDSVLRSDNSLTDSSKSVWVVSERVTEYIDLIHRTDISENQDIQIQTDL